MMRFAWVFLILFSLESWHVHAQNTVGLLSYDPLQSSKGYNLFFPNNQSNVYLINNCGEIVNQWEDSNDFRPGNSVYITEEGNLIKCKRNADVTESFLWAGGGGGIVEILDWDNNLLWSFELNDSIQRLHHDIASLQNGNILMLAWEKFSKEQAIEAGRNPNTLAENELWSEFIFEINPSTNEIIWEWHAWDHLIQDHDSSKSNYGTVKDHPELLDLNWDTSDGDADWLHANSIHYNEQRKHIVLSIPTFNEVWIIDHTTTTEEAMGHAGGLSGKGGDLLYRWGNPAAYKSGTAEQQKLFFQHDAKFITDFLPPDHPDLNKMILFNNRVGGDYSSVNIFEPDYDEVNRVYAMNDGRYLPQDFEWSFIHPKPMMMYSPGLSGVEYLPNDNILICTGRTGYSFETTKSGNIVWEYKTPFINGIPAEQGEQIDHNDNFTFRMIRYPDDYSGFQGKDLSPKGFIEIHPDTTFCNRLTSTDPNHSLAKIRVYPNPAFDEIRIKGLKSLKPNVSMVIYDIVGRPMMSHHLSNQDESLNVSHLNPGVYFIKVDEFFIQKIIISNN